MSANRPDSDLERVNRAAGIAPEPVPPDLWGLLGEAVWIAGISGGAFDPTIGPLVKLWDIGGDHPRVPDQDEIDALLPLVDWRGLDLGDGTAGLPRPGTRLDLGGLAKGYAADEAARIIREAGVRRALIDLGGNIMVVGEKAGGAPWRVGVQNPEAPRGVYLGVMEIRDQALVTSGVYERAFEEAGRRYHHILSPRDGRPVDNGLLSVTVLSSRSTLADGLSTALFVMGVERGFPLAASLPDVEALFVGGDHVIHGTPGALAVFTPRDEGWRVAGGP